MKESKIRKPGKTKVVIPPRPKEIKPEVAFECPECKTQVLNKEPIGYKEIDGKKIQLCLKCAKKK